MTINSKKYAIVLPAGSGKSTLANKYEKLYDIDSFLTFKDKQLLKESCSLAMKTNNWTNHLKNEYNAVNDKIKLLPKGSIVLVHCESKATMYNLELLGIYKTTKKEMLKVAKERGKDSIFREKCTIHNWMTTNNAIICTHHNIEQHIIKLLKKNFTK